jgi:hypothetical protein
MQIFISWSGQTSYRVAILIRDLIRKLLPELELWVSAEDIQDGSRWSPDMIRILEQCIFSIICVDPSNHQLPWLNFELGAIARTIGKWNIKVFLFELRPSELRGPLTQYQPVKVDKNDVMRLLDDLTANFPHIEISHDELKQNLENIWPDFYKAIAQISLDSPKETSDQQQAEDKLADSKRLDYIDEIDEKILVLLFVNEGIDEDRISTTVYQTRGDTLKHLISLEKMNLVWSNMSFGTRRWYISDLGRKYLPGIYQE